MKKHSIYFVLLVLMGICCFYIAFFSLITIMVLAILTLEYHLFYTKRPAVYLFFYLTGIGIAVWSLFGADPLFPSIYIAVVFLECVRVFVMALLRYPSTISELEQLTEELEERVASRTVELQRANQQLAEANHDLQQLDQMKTAFVSQASHDLRTPLTAIKGSLDNLLIGIAGEVTEKQKKILNRASRSVDRLTVLINDILDLNRIETGRVQLEKQSVTLNHCVLNLIAEHHPAAALKNIRVQFDPDSGDCKVHADPGKLERVIGELIGNAIKYTDEGGQVSVSLQQQDEHIDIIVKDNGYGLSEDELDKIFERFYRVAETQHKAKGSGLGLSIAKEIIELHDGTILVESRPGEGTTFIIQLPCKKQR